MLLKRSGVLATTLMLMALLLTLVPVMSVGDRQPAQQASADCRKAPRWKGKDTKFGLGLSTTGHSNLHEDLTEEQKRFGTRVPVVRTWDTGMPRSYAWSERSEWFGKRWIVTSLKLDPRDVLAGKHDAELRNYFRTAPRKQPIFYNFFHEPEDDIKAGNYTAAQFREAFRHIVDIASSYCRTNLYPTLVLMSWTVNPGSHLDWRDYYPGDKYVSVLGWDPYNGANGDAKSYRSPKEIFSRVVRVSKAAHKRFGIAETGTVRVPGDSAGTGRATWLRATAKYLDKRNAAFVTYFQSTNKGDFELRDKPSVAAWAQAMKR